jgi:hypothetical protein
MSRKNAASSGSAPAPEHGVSGATEAGLVSAARAGVTRTRSGAQPDRASAPLAASRPDIAQIAAVMRERRCLQKPVTSLAPDGMAAGHDGIPAGPPTARARLSGAARSGSRLGRGMP